MSDSAYGECLIEDFRLEYKVINLTYIYNRFLHIEAICHNHLHPYDKEAVFRYNTTLFSSNDKKLKIALLIIDSIIKDLDIPSNITKLSIVNGKVFYIYLAK
jgi:hypothetical protein